MRHMRKKLAEVPLLLIFSRAPVPGHCKTRLIRRYGAEGAARVQRRLIQKTLATAQAAAIPAELWCEPNTGHSYFLRRRRSHGLALHPQPAGDLGHRMAGAISNALRHGAGKAVIIGTDCAALTAEDLHAAFKKLDECDCVIKPAADGGYVLIGARRPVNHALRDISWSSGDELRQTCQRLRLRGFSLELLPLSWDVDHPRDLRRAKRDGLI